MPTNTAETLNQITSRIIEAAIEIHRAFGPGLLESAYLTCLTRDLLDAQLRVKTEHPIPLVYKNVKVDCAYRADLVAEESVLVEVSRAEIWRTNHERRHHASRE